MMIFIYIYIYDIYIYIYTYIYINTYKTIVVITEKANCFHDYIYITPILLLSNLSTVCVLWIT